MSELDVTYYKFETRDWPPPDDRRDRRYYLFGFDADNQPYIVKWGESDRWKGWRAVSLDDRQHDTAEPIAHILEDVNAGLIVRWADAPLRWSELLGDEE